MGWFDRIFKGASKPAAPVSNAQVASAKTESGETIPPAKVGPDGQFDESGLAKRVALAIDEDPSLTNLDRLWVAQLGGTVVFRGEVPSQDLLNKAVSIANGVSGATGVQTDEVKVG